MYLTNLTPGISDPVYTKTKNEKDETKANLKKTVIFENRKEPQKWKIEPVEKCSNLALVYIRTADKPHFYLECNENHNVSVSLRKGSINQHWIITPRGRGFNIMSKHSGKYLSYSYVGKQLYKDQGSLMMSNDRRMIWFFDNSTSKITIPKCSIKEFVEQKAINTILNGMYVYNYNNIVKINLNIVEKNYIAGELILYSLPKNKSDKSNNKNKIIYKIKSIRRELDVQNNKINPYVMTGELVYNSLGKKYNFINLRFIFNKDDIELIPKVYNNSNEIISLFPDAKLNSKGIKITTDKECMIKIQGRCDEYPTMSNNEWFKDYEYGGPIPTNNLLCKRRKSFWDKNCGKRSFVGMKFRKNKKDSWEYDYPKKCQMEIKGKCKRYLNMSNKSWFNDNEHSSSKPSTLISCLSRQKSWENSCGNDAIVNMKYTNSKNQSKIYPGTDKTKKK